MDMLKKYFPFSFKAKDVAGLAINILIYLGIGAIAGIIIGVFTGIPLIGIVASVVGFAAEAYVFAGIVLALLDYFSIIK